MQISIKQLRRIVREEVDRCVQWSAGFTGGANVGSGVYNEQNPLGDDKINDETGIETTVGNNNGEQIQFKPRRGL